MKNNFKGIMILGLLSLLLVTACDSSEDTNNEIDLQLQEEINRTKAKLIGEWVLVSSSIGGVDVSSENFKIIKSGNAMFNEDDTYQIYLLEAYREFIGYSYLSSSFTGTYRVEGLDNISFGLSEAKISLVDNVLKITTDYYVTRYTSQPKVDVFLRADNTDLEKEEDSLIDSIVESEEEDPNTIGENYDGSAVIDKMIGKWQIEGGSDDCVQKNTVEFKSNTQFEIVQHKATFNRSDLLKNNINVSYPMPATFHSVVTNGGTTVVFDTSTECQFVKTSVLEYVVTDANTIKIKNNQSVYISVIDDETIKFVYTYKDDNGKDKNGEVIYKKVVE